MRNKCMLSQSQKILKNIICRAPLFNMLDFVQLCSNYKFITNLKVRKGQQLELNTKTFPPHPPQLCMVLLKDCFFALLEMQLVSSVMSGVGSLSLLQEIFPTQGSNPGLLHCRQILYQLSYQGRSWYLQPGYLSQSWFKSVKINKQKPHLKSTQEVRRGSAPALPFHADCRLNRKKVTTDILLCLAALHFADIACLLSFF